MHLQSVVAAILALIVGIASLAVAGPSGALVAASLSSPLVFGLTNPLLTVLAGFAQVGLVNGRNAVPGENATFEIALTAHEEGDLLARQVPGGSTGVICVPVPGQPWYDASGDVITRQGIPYLDQVTNPCNVGPGPGNCVRVSCSYSAAIYLCNDNTWTITPSCSEIASYAQYIVDSCSTPSEGLPGEDWGPQAGGQAFSNQRWNVIVRNDNC